MSPPPPGDDPARRFGVIDIGTNSLKLMVASANHARVDVCHVARVPTRLGRGLAATGRIGDAAARRTATAVKQLVREARTHGAQDVSAVGTHALRTARNGRAVARAIGQRAGVRVRILTGTEEAGYVLAAVRPRIRRPRGHLMVVDIGGGSAQMSVARGTRVLLARSVPLGAVVLTERHLYHDPIEPEEYARLAATIDAVVSRLFARLPRWPPARVDLVVAGGTATTVAAMTGVRAEGSGCSVSIAMLRTLEARCLAATIEERRRFPGLQPDRADILPAGLAVLLAFARHARKRTVRIVDGGWREGIILERAQAANRSRPKTRTRARATAAARKGR